MKDYDYPRAQEDLARGVAPGVVALRLGVSEETLIEQADSLGWPISWSGQTAQQSIDAGERFL